MKLNEALTTLERAKGEDLATVVSTLIETAGRLTGSSLSYFALMNEPGDVLTMVGWSKTAMDACSMIDKPIDSASEES